MVVQSIVNGMIGLSVIAPSHVEEESEQISDLKTSQLNMGAMNVQVQDLLKKAVTFRNAEVIVLLIL